MNELYAGDDTVQDLLAGERIPEGRELHLDSWEPEVTTRPRQQVPEKVRHLLYSITPNVRPPCTVQLPMWGHPVQYNSQCETTLYSGHSAWRLTPNQMYIYSCSGDFFLGQLGINENLQTISDFTKRDRKWRLDCIKRAVHGSVMLHCTLFTLQ